jgi:hypothetical protein
MSAAIVRDGIDDSAKSRRDVGMTNGDEDIDADDTDDAGVDGIIMIISSACGLMVVADALMMKESLSSRRFRFFFFKVPV